MKKSDLEKLLNSCFREKLKPLGFKKYNSGFVKIKDDFSYKFILSSVNRDTSYPSTFAYMLSCKLVGSVLGNVIGISDAYFPVRGGGQAELWESKKYPVKDYDIYTEDDAKKMVAEVSAYFTNEALPYLESISNLHALEALTNSNPHPLKFRSGLVLAKLVDNPQYDSLVEQYRESFKGWVVEWDKTDFEKMVAFLDCHSLDELHAMAE